MFEPIAPVYELRFEATPSGGGTIDWGGRNAFAAGEEVMAVAQPESGFGFSYWVVDGQEGGSDPVLTFAMPDHDTDVSAVFAALPAHTLTVSANDEDWGYVSGVGNGEYQAGNVVALTAEPEEGYRFIRWESSDGQTTLSTNREWLYTMPDGDVSLVAVFGPGLEVCEVNGVKYDTLREAFDSVKSDGGTQAIKLLADITETELLEVGGFVLIFDLNGFDLTIDTSAEEDSTALLVGNGGHIDYTGTGSFTVIGHNYGVVASGESASATVTGAKAYYQSAVYVSGHLVSVTVNGDVEAFNGAAGVSTWGPDFFNGAPTATVNGNVRTIGANSAGVSAEGGTVTINGNITSDGGGVSSRSHSSSYPTSVVIEGNVTAGDTGVYVADDESTVRVKGHVVAGGTGIFANTGGEAVVDGTVSAVDYVRLNDEILSQNDYDEESADGYYIYRLTGESGGLGGVVRVGSHDASADAEAPVLTAGTVSRAESSATVTFTASETGRYYYKVLDASVEAPTAEEVLYSPDNSGGTGMGTAEQTIELSLATASAKKIYILGVDPALNRSALQVIDIPIFTLGPGYIYFGKYPQREITDPQELAGLTENADYMVVDAAESSTGEEQYYLLEPIAWRILEESDGTLLLMSHKILNEMPFNNVAPPQGDEPAIRAIWSEVSLRAWLNGDFLNGAFTEAERNAILVSNVAYPDKPPVEDTNTTEGTSEDKVFVLSVNEAVNPDYDFNADLTAEDQLRVAVYTDYAATRSGWSKDSWWLRSQCEFVIQAAYVRYTGAVNHSGGVPDGQYADWRMTLGVRPALRVSASFFESAD